MRPPVVKHSFLVRSARELLEVLREAFRIAASGRKGPVLVDVPKDVQLEEAEFRAWPEPSRADPPRLPEAEAIEKAAAIIAAARRPSCISAAGSSRPRPTRSLPSFRARRPSRLPLPSWASAASRPITRCTWA